MVGPTSVFFSHAKNEIIIADTKKMTIDSYDGLDFTPGNNVDLRGAENVFSIVSGEKGYYYTDIEKNEVHRVDESGTEDFTLAGNLFRPTQIHIEDGTGLQGDGICTSETVVHCSHICLPRKDQYDCTCPDHLYLADDYYTCVASWDSRHQYTTQPPPTVSTTTTTTTTTTSTAIEDTTYIDVDGYYYVPEIDYEEFDENYIYEVDSNSVNQGVDSNFTEVTIKKIATTPLTITISTNATSFNTTISVISTTTVATTTTATTIPPPPVIVNCPATRNDRFQLRLDPGEPFATISAEKFNMTGQDGHGKELEIKRFKGTKPTLHAGVRQMVDFFIQDNFNQSDRCTFKIDIIDSEPPRVLYCPEDLLVNTFRRDNNAYVTWPEPEWADNVGVANVSASSEPGFYPIGLHTITYSASDDAKNSVSCTFNIFIKQDQPRCGIPMKPPNSELTCRTDTELRLQVCAINCLPGFESALDAPRLTCNISSTAQYPEWLPIMDDKICQKPIIGKAKKTIQLTYDSPCIKDPEFYETSIALLSPQIKNMNECKSSMKKSDDARIAFCKNPKQYLKIECVNDRKINLNVTAELADTKNLKTTATAKKFVDMTINEVRKVAVNGNLTMRGTDKKRYAAREISKDKAVIASPLQVVCDRGQKVVNSGCVICPKGTYLKNNECRLCPTGWYNEIPGSDRCYRCPQEKTTKSEGATYWTHCIDRVAEPEQNNFPIIIGVGAGAFLILLLIVICVVCKINKKRRRRQADHAASVQRAAKRIQQEKEEQERRREKEEREREEFEANLERHRHEHAREKALQQLRNSMNVIGDDDAQEDRPGASEQIEPELSDGEYEKSISNSENDEEELDKEVASMTKDVADGQLDDQDVDPEESRGLGPKSILRKVSKYEKSEGEMGAKRVQALRSTMSMSSQGQNQFQNSSPQMQQVVRRASMAQMSPMGNPGLPPQVQRTASMSMTSGDLGFNPYGQPTQQQMMNQQAMMGSQQQLNQYDMVRPHHMQHPGHVPTPPDQIYDVPRNMTMGSHMGSMVGSQMNACKLGGSQMGGSQMGGSQVGGSQIGGSQMGSQVGFSHGRQGSFMSSKSHPSHQMNDFNMQQQQQRMMPQNFQQGGPPPGHFGPQDGPYQEQMQYGQPYDPSQVSVIPPQGYY